MSDRHSLRLAIVPDPSRASFTGSDYWLRLEQITDRDIAEPAEWAEIIDELYGLEACSPEPTPEEEKPPITLERLMEIAKRRLDIEECRRRASGDYTARVKVIYSHPGDASNRPKLSVTIGRIVSQQIVSEDITLTLSVREQKSLTLDYPVPQEEGEEWPGTAKWLGSVFNEEAGPIPPPKITGSGNVLSWPTTATGTILVKVATTYELATISVPGIPRLGSLAGDSQSTLLRAFWRLQVYELQVEAISPDTTANQQTLAEICGWESLTGGGSGDDDEDGSESDGEGDDGEGDDDGPELGCLEPAPELRNPAYYKEICCEPPPFGLPDCALSATSRQPVQLPDDVQERYRRDSRGKVEFVAVGPGPDGCGRLLVHQQINRRNCCIDVEPMSAHPENPTYISPGGSEILVVLGGKNGAFWRWEASGGLRFDNGSSVKVTTNHAEWVYAPEATCPRHTVRVDDTCGILTMALTTATEPLSLAVVDEDQPAMGQVTLLITGGAAPYYLTTSGQHTNFANGEKSIELATAGAVDVFIDREQVCDGDFRVNASDACAYTDEVTIDVIDMPVGIACIDHYVTSVNWTRWIFDCSESGSAKKTPQWISYEYIGPRLGGSGSYKKNNLPQMGEKKFKGSSGLRCSSFQARIIEITSGELNDLPAWLFWANEYVHAQEIPDFCEECHGTVSY
jgi:hypothetical protein